MHRNLFAFEDMISPLITFTVISIPYISKFVNTIVYIQQFSLFPARAVVFENSCRRIVDVAVFP